MVLVGSKLGHMIERLDPCVACSQLAQQNATAMEQLRCLFLTGEAMTISQLLRLQVGARFFLEAKAAGWHGLAKATAW